MLRRILLFTAIATQSLHAQSAPTIHTTADLAQHEANLLTAAKAAPTGVAFDTIDDFGYAKTLIVVRVHTGEAELHDRWADQMVITKGTVTLVTGGTLTGAHSLPNQPGETRATSIEGGTEIVLHTGEIAHIPAGLPHWVKLAPGTTTTYFVFKEK
jgi:hypothetical protein